MADRREPLSTMEETLGPLFKDQGLLTRALTHSSYVNEHPEESEGSNERLEFLGDAIIGLVVAQEIYRRYPELDEGALTEMRSTVVRGETLARVASRLGLGRHLLMGRGEEASGGRERESNLAGALEALAGAVLIDRGYRVSRGWVIRILGPELRRITKRGVSRDSKSRLQELAHQLGMRSPQYEVIGMEGPEHRRRFTVRVTAGDRVIGQGAGSSKSEAEREAAEEALRGLS